MVDWTEVHNYFQAGKDALGLLKDSYALLPKGPQRDQAVAKIAHAEESLNRADVALAKSLGYTLCQCTFPPQIMLWRERDRSTVCPNPDCGRTIKALTYAELRQQSAQRTRRSNWLNPHGDG